MTTEQREAIDRLGYLLKKGKYGVVGKMLLYDDYYMLKNVLEVVENQEQKIIEQQEEIKNLQKELNEENKRCMILANKDKFKEQVIDLMTETFYKRFKAELLIEYGFENEEQLKQCFANKVNSKIQ